MQSAKCKVQSAECKIEDRTCNATPLHFILHFAFCILHFALCTLHFALCIPPFPACSPLGCQLRFLRETPNNQADGEARLARLVYCGPQLEQTAHGTRARASPRFGVVA